MKCLKCLNEVNDDVKFCPECGEPLQSTLDTGVRSDESISFNQKSICLVCKGKGKKDH